MKSIQSIVLLTVFILLSIVFVAHAQEGDQCPAIVRNAVSALEIACEDTGANEACYVYPPVNVSLADGAGDITFDTPGDVIPISAIDSLELNAMDIASETWGMATWNINTDAGGVNVLTFGDIQVSNAVQPTTAGGGVTTLTANAPLNGINVRRQANTSSPIIWQLSPNAEVLVTGRHTNGDWLRIELPTRTIGENVVTGGIGWVYLPVMRVAGDVNTLGFVDENSPAPEIRSTARLQRMQAFTFESDSDDAPCPQAPASGMILQSWNPDEPLDIQVNGVTISVGGTLFMQAQAGGNLIIVVVEGNVMVSANGVDRAAIAGQQTIVPLTDELTPFAEPRVPEPAPATAIQAVPLGVLPRVIGEGETAAPQPAPESDGDAVVSQSAPNEEVEGCTLTAPVDIPEPLNMRAGPGLDFAVTNNLAAGASVDAVGQRSDPFNYVWYVTNNGDWIRNDTVDATAGCADLPTADMPAEAPAAVPTPGTFSLVSSVLGEVCSASSIGRTERSDGSQLFITIGGTWTATAGTTANFSVLGSLFRGEFGDYIRLVDSTGNILAQSGQETSLTYTFAADTTFEVQLVAARDDNVTLTAVCVQ